jgi:hypothetical protein
MTANEPTVHYLPILSELDKAVILSAHVNANIIACDGASRAHKEHRAEVRGVGEEVRGCDGR